MAGMSFEELMMGGVGSNSPPQSINQYINEIEIQQIQMKVWDFFSAYTMGDDRRCTIILGIILNIVKTRQPQLPTLQQYFKGKKIGRFRNRISTKMAAEYVAFVGSEVRKMTDNRIKSVPIE